MSTTQTVQAIYENGVLRPIQPLSLSEREQVSITVTTESAVAPTDFEGVMGCASGAGPGPTVEEVRAITAKIPVSLSVLIRQERDECR